MTRGLVALALVAAALLAPRAARAQEDEEAGGNRVPVALFIVGDTALPAKTMANLTRGLETALKRNQRIELKDKDLVLAEFAGEVPEDKVDRARSLFAEGAAALEGGDADTAVARLSEAEKAFEPVLAHVKKNELADAQFLLGVAHATAGDKKKAKATFARLQAWRPTYQWDVERYSSVLPLWEQAREELSKAPRGSLELLSDPEGAMVFVDGKYIGVTPTAADGLVVGDHYVTFKLEGYQRRVVRATVDPRYQELVTESLPRSEKYLLVEQSVDGSMEALGDETAPATMVDLRKFLFVDMAVFVRIAPLPKGKGAGAPAKVKVDAWVYDLRTKQRLAQVKGATLVLDEPDELTTSVDKLVGTLFANVKYDGAAPAVVSKRRRGPPAPTPFYKKAWFWGAVVGAAAIIATPIVFQDELFPPAPPSCPGGQICTGVVTE